MAGGFPGVVEGWVTTITTGLEEGQHGGAPLDHKLVKRLLPQFLEGMAEAEALTAELDAAIKAATAPPEDEEDVEAEDEGDTPPLDPAQLKDMKRDLTAAKKKLKQYRQHFTERLRQAQQTLNADDAQVLVLEMLRDDLATECHRRITAHRQAITAAVQNWWDKYRITLRDIETDRDTAKQKLDTFLEELGYGG